MNKFKKGDKISGKIVEKTLFNFDVLSLNCDIGNKGWVVVFSDDSKEIVLMKQEKPYIADWSEINSIVEGYKKAIVDIKTAISL